MEKWARERGASLERSLYMSLTDIHTALLKTFHSGLKKYYVVLPSNSNVNNHFSRRDFAFANDAGKTCLPLIDISSCYASA